MQLWKVTFVSQGTYVEALASAFEDDALAVSWIEVSEDDDTWQGELIFKHKPDEAVIREKLQSMAQSLAGEVSQITIEAIDNTDWLEATWRNFPPQTIGRFFVYGSHYEGERPGDKVQLHVNAATAFGSGEHETTRGCLLNIDQLAQDGFNPSRALDMGCGSGILALAIAKIWGVNVMAVDNDPEAVRVAEYNVHLNETPQVQCLVSQGFEDSIVSKSGPYPLIVANILAQPLIDMAASMAQALDQGGYLILSGLLTRQKQDVLSAYEEQGLTFVRGVEENNWQALLLTKPKH